MLRRRGLAAGTAFLAVAALAWSATPASAQHHGGGHGGGHGGAHVSSFHGGYQGGYHGGYHAYHPGYYGGGYGYHHGYYPGFWSGFGIGLGLGYLRPGYGYGYGYYPGYSYGYSPSYSYNVYDSGYVPDYSYSGFAPEYYSYNPNYGAYPAVPGGYSQLNTVPGPSGAAPVFVQVQVPANAEVLFNGARTTQTGTVRSFESPPITPDKNYTYDITARWAQDGKEVTRSRSVAVHPGQRVAVDFTQPELSQPAAPAASNSAPPPPPLPLEPAPVK